MNKRKTTSSSKNQDFLLAIPESKKNQTNYTIGKKKSHTFKNISLNTTEIEQKLLFIDSSQPNLDPSHENIKNYKSHPNIISSNYIKLDQTSIKKHQELVKSLNNNGDQSRQKHLKRRETTSFKIPTGFLSPKPQQNKFSKINKFKRRKSLDKEKEQILLSGIPKLTNNIKNPQKNEILFLNKEIERLKISNQFKENKIKQLEKQIVALKSQNKIIMLKNKQIQTQLIQLKKAQKNKYQPSEHQTTFLENFISDVSINQIVSEVQKKFDVLNNSNSLLNIDATTTEQLNENLQQLEKQLYHKKQEVFKLNKVIEQMLTKQHCQELKHQEQIKKLQKRWNLKFYKLNQELKEAKLREQKSNKLFLDTDRQSIFNLSACDSFFDA